MEEVDSISVAVSNIDINLVEPLENRRVVAFLNHFLCSTVTFLNQFATKCEYKLDQIQQKLFKIESALRILECKLDSLPEEQELLGNSVIVSTNENHTLPSGKLKTDKENEISNVTPVDSSNSKNVIPPDTELEKHQQKNVVDASDLDDENVDKTTKQSAREDPRYAKYFKMMYVGVPAQAIKQKMMSEGVDPSILDS